MQTVKKVYYDKYLGIEAFYFSGISRLFQNHFHDYYVVCFIEKGRRILYCKNSEYIISPGDFVLFNPFENHTCFQLDSDYITFRSINIPDKVMKAYIPNKTKNNKFIFKHNVVKYSDLNKSFCNLHKMVVKNVYLKEKEAMFMLFMSDLVLKFGTYINYDNIDSAENIALTCSFIINNYSQDISLSDLCRCSNMSKSALLRGFLKYTGVTPYRYLQTVRINKAKTMLQNGISIVEAALNTGFFDQSHFTKTFSGFIGVSPSMYVKSFNGRIKR